MKRAKSDSVVLAEMYTSLRRDYNDLRVVAGANVDTSGFTLLALLKNEIYFLPAFLAHYRDLGVKRFVFLNDRSDDGSFDYLRNQNDTVVVQSARTYGESIEIPSSFRSRIKHLRAMQLWRSLLCDEFVQDRWCLQVDLDEFAHLPKGMMFHDLTERLEQQGIRAVWGVMLDVYPADIAALAELEHTARLDTSTTWYFDGQQHLSFLRSSKPTICYPGARARLYRTYGVDRLYPKVMASKLKRAERLLRRPWLGAKPMKYNMIRKPILLKWDQSCYFRSSHDINMITSRDYLLPIQHFRFTGDIYRRVQRGIREGAYYNGSLDYRLISELLQTMKARNGSFQYRKSRPLQSFDDLVATRNAFGL